MSLNSNIRRGREYRVQFLNDANMVVHEKRLNAGSPANAFLNVVDRGWPRDALSARVLDQDERNVLCVSKPKGGKMKNSGPRPLARKP